MTSGRLLIGSTLMTVALSVAAPARAQDAAPAEVEFEATEVGPGLYMIQGVGGFGGGNIGLITGDDGVMLIDSTFPPLTDKVLAAVAEITSDPVDFVINTHLHGDHVGGNPQLTEDGTHVVAHENVRRRLAAQGIQTAPGQFADAPPEMLPVLTFADAITVHLNGQDAHVRHVPAAHTDGDAIIHFMEADVIHAGDVLFNGIFPFIDGDSGGTLDGYIAGQALIVEMAGPATKIIAGHGPLASRADVEASVAMLEDAKKKIQALIDDGKSVDEIIAANPLGAYESWSWGFIPTERMIRQVHAHLTNG